MAQIKIFGLKSTLNPIKAGAHMRSAGRINPAPTAGDRKV